MLGTGNVDWINELEKQEERIGQGVDARTIPSWQHRDPFLQASVDKHNSELVEKISALPASLAEARRKALMV
jgi:hypothetical protein